MMGVLLAMALLATQAGAGAPASVRVAGVERVVDRVLIHIAADAVAGAVPSEPFHLGGGRTRVFITLPDALLAAPFDSILPHAGMLALRADGYNGNVRITADVASLGDYGVERTPTGLDLWLDLARPAPAAATSVAPPLWHDRLNGYAADARVLMDAALGRLGAVDWRATMSPVRVAILVTLLLLPLAAWRLFHGTAPKPAASGRGAGASPDRIRAARALAGEGVGGDEIARRTGISRDVAHLLVRRPDPAKAAGDGNSFRAGHPRADGRRNA